MTTGDTKSGEVKLAEALLLQCIDQLRTPPPPPVAPRNPKDYPKWKHAWTSWVARRRTELSFISDPRSLGWFEIVGMDRDVVVSRLRISGLLYDPDTVVPHELTEV